MTEPMHTIGALCREFDVTARTLRFYEAKRLLSPVRDGARRLFTARDRARLRLILQGKRFGFALEDMRELLDLHDLGDLGAAQRRRTVAKAEERLAAMKAQRAALDAAIDELAGLIRAGRALPDTQCRQAS
jgi:DNA-binding transcriptional MerR regulator